MPSPYDLVVGGTLNEFTHTLKPGVLRFMQNLLWIMYVPVFQNFNDTNRPIVVVEFSKQYSSHAEMLPLNL